MFELSQKQANWILTGLVALMAATRFDHFGSINTLPDASLAVFFIAGVYVGRFWVFPLLLIETGVIDYVAITQGGVSDYCISGGYAFLIPAYAVMWIGGRQFTDKQLFNVDVAMKMLVSIIVAVSAAFVISNVGFYLYSSNFGELGVWEYTTRVMRYYPPYVTTALLYSTLILALHGVFRQCVDRVEIQNKSV